jgi:RHS repeat-associated protein
MRTTRWPAGLPQVQQDGAGNRYVYGLDLISRTDSLGNQEYELSDGLGSTTGLADGTGAVTDTYTYDVYGAVRSRTGTSPNEFTYTGEQVDSSGLQYLRARYYDAANGRFASRDPLGAAEPYAYVSNNPANLIDPTGLCGVRDFYNCPSDWAKGALGRLTGGGYGRTSDAEKSWCFRHLRMCAQGMVLRTEALAVTEQEYGCKTRENLCVDDQGDAFRHCYWSGIVTITWGPSAAADVATRHEDSDSGNYEGAKQMDLFNNAAGRWLGAAHTPDRGALRSACRGAADSGQLIRLQEIK